MTRRVDMDWLYRDPWLSLAESMRELRGRLWIHYGCECVLAVDMDERIMLTAGVLPGQSMELDGVIFRSVRR